MSPSDSSHLIFTMECQLRWKLVTDLSTKSTNKEQVTRVSCSGTHPTRLQRSCQHRSTLLTACLNGSQTFDNKKIPPCHTSYPTVKHRSPLATMNITYHKV